MNIELILQIPVALINLCMGLLVLVRGPQRLSSRYFAVSALFLALWGIGDFLLLTSDDPSVAFLGAKMFFVAPLITTLYLVFFALTFPSNKPVRPLIQYGLMTVVLLLIALVILRLDVFAEIIINRGAATNIMTINALGFIPYAAYFVSMFIASYVIFLQALRRYVGYQRDQILYSLIGIFLSSFLASLTNLAWPLLGATQFVWLGPLFTAFYVITTSYAIVRHRLFDIRLVIARAVGYLLLLTTLAIIYALVLFTLSSSIFGETTPLGGREVAYIAVAVFLSFTFQPLKRFFDKITNRIFYQDAYDTQQVLDRLGSLLVSEVEVKQLSVRSLNILRDALKVDFIVLNIPNHGTVIEEHAYFSVGTRVRQDLQPLFKTLRHSSEAILVQDELTHESVYFKMMQRANVAVAARLATSKEHLGYAIFGFKASGNSYNSQDIDLIRIVMDELALATQNALRFAEIQQFNITLQQRIHEATDQLRQSNRKLQALDQAKDEFISMASHQLRTPLTSVKGYLSMVLDGDAGPVKEDQRKLLQEAFGSSQRMVYLIGDFLNVSRLQTGKFLLEPRPANLSQLVQEEVEQLGSTAARRNIRLHYEPPAHFPLLTLDETKIRQVVMNFIDNAIFYSLPSSEVRIELMVTAKEVCLKVHDSGIGIPPAEQHKIFSKFFRATNARNARPDGTGIGLFMAKKVVLAHGGNLIFESKENKGSTFGFCLPLHPHLKNPAK